jgi:hypothetical protein
MYLESRILVVFPFSSVADGRSLVNLPKKKKKTTKTNREKGGGIGGGVFFLHLF